MSDIFIRFRLLSGNVYVGRALLWINFVIGRFVLYPRKRAASVIESNRTGFASFFIGVIKSIIGRSENQSVVQPYLRGLPRALAVPGGEVREMLSAFSFKAKTSLRRTLRRVT